MVAIAAGGRTLLSENIAQHQPIQNIVGPCIAGGFLRHCDCDVLQTGCFPQEFLDGLVLPVKCVGEQIIEERLQPACDHRGLAVTGRS